MQFSLERHAVAPWVSWRNYSSNFEHRTIISNEKTHEYLLLEGESANVWRALTAGDISYLSLNANELEVFCSSLLDAGLIISVERNNYATDNVPLEIVEVKTDGQGDSAGFEREMADWAWQHGFLFHAHLELTYRCNETCVHCYNPGASLLPDDRPDRQRDELSTDDWKQVINELAEIGVFQLNISGGEATLRKDFFELVTHARQLGFAVIVFTNGLNCPPNFVKKLAQLWPHSVEVSIYSAAPNLHDEITKVPGSFLRSVDCLRQLHSAGLRAVMKTTLMRSTIFGHADCQRLAESLGVGLVIGATISPNADGRKSPLLLNPDFETLVSLAMTPGSLNSVTHKDREERRDIGSPVCGAGRKTISVNPEGDITPCSSMPWIVGSVRDVNLASIWRDAIASRVDSKTVQHARAAITANNSRNIADWQAIVLQDFDECSTHDRCRWCEEICPGDALVLTGNPLASVEHRCMAASARMIASQRLAAGLSGDLPATTNTNKTASHTMACTQQVAYPIFQLHLVDDDGEYPRL